MAALPADSDAMMLSELDGYLAGIVVCPDLIMPSEWLPGVWGADARDAAPVFTSLAEVETLTGHVMQHYNGVTRDL